MGISYVQAMVVRQEAIATDIFSMELQAPELAQDAKAGQFINLYSKDGSRLLPRPISLCQIDRNTGRLRLVYRVVGKGTFEFSGYQSGDRIQVAGPLGNGFTPLPGKAVVIGGGIGIPPMLQLVRELPGEVQVVLGYRNEVFLEEDFSSLAKVYYASEDGKHGVKGTVMDAIREYGIQGDVIYACGPMPMLRAIQAYALERKIKAQLSLEERMACGVGACLACVCRSKERDAHTNVNNKRICKDGPVFYAEEVDLT